MTIEYIGHKEQHLRLIVETIQDLTDGKPALVADLFCGTGCVSGGLKGAGYSVIANDTLAVCVRMTEAVLLNSGPPRFTGIQHLVNRISGVNAYECALAALNAAKPRIGFITRTYSPYAKRISGYSRRYFTTDNAMRIDGIRYVLKQWQPLLTRSESALLISDLVLASNAVSNVAAVYGGFLKQWKTRATKSLTLAPRVFVPGRKLGHRVLNMDAAALAPRITPRVIYADPPYTKRQYAAYYHIPETLAIGDSPRVEGRTGLRPWASKSSQWCYKRHAGNELENLLVVARAPYIVLSYSEDGQISHADIVAILRSHGTCSYREIPSRRYKAAAGRHKGPTAIERLYVLRRKK